ncbi:hypothetical protein FHR34_003356 [Kitasatospora kifunensis]|uniref:Uncharacterized protein n=1 Tax=Kitasatospora kifunensis TaxID=58351 RepID=A0A7W7R2S0_KITKI|nr:hypothetical protein [Kitasatospora kifunensis]
MFSDVPSVLPPDRAITGDPRCHRTYFGSRLNFEVDQK